MLRPKGVASARPAAGLAAARAFLYWKPAHAYCDAKRELQSRRAEVQRPAGRAREARDGGSRRPAPASSSPARRGALGLVKPGEQLFIVKGIAAWRRQHWAASLGSMDDREIVAAAARPAAACVPARRRALPLRPAGRDRAGAVRRDGARSRRSSTSRARTSSRRSRGSRRPAASSAGRAPRRSDAALAREPRARARREQRRAPARARGRASAARRARGSLKCLHAHAAFALARPGLRARRPDPRRAARRSGRDVAAVLPDRVDVELARQQWQDGSRRVETRRADDGSALPRLPARSTSWSRSCGGASARRSRSPSSPTPTTARTTGRASCSTTRTPTARPPSRPAPSPTPRSTRYARGAADYRP